MATSVVSDESEVSGDLRSWGFDSNTCTFCGVVNEAIAGLLLQCGRCKKAYYCSQQCFNADLGSHSKQCNTGTLDGYLPDHSKATDLPCQSDGDTTATKSVTLDDTRTTLSDTKELPELTHEEPNVSQENSEEDTTSIEADTDTREFTEVDNVVSNAELVLAVTCGSYTADGFKNILQTIPPGPIYPCRCNRENCGVVQKAVVAQQATPCPQCEAEVGLSNLDGEQNDNDNLHLKCSECNFAFHVPRLQINDATDPTAPRMPTRSMDGEDRCPRLPSRCPECDCDVRHCCNSDQIPTKPFRCPECDITITVPRIQINDAVDKCGPKMPQRSSDVSPGEHDTVSPPHSVHCRECDFCIEATIAPKDGAPRLPKRCPECDVVVVLPRVQLNDATDLHPPQKPIRCHDCDYCIEPIEGPTDGIPKLPKRCPECDATLVLPRVQINDSTDMNAPKKPIRRYDDICTPLRSFDETRDGPPVMPIRCEECEGFLVWSKKNEAESRVPQDLTGRMLRTGVTDVDLLQESITMFDIDASANEDLAEANKNQFEISLREIVPEEKEPLDREDSRTWTIALRKVETQCNASFNSSCSSFSTVDLRKAETLKREIFWEKPEWTRSFRLRKTKRGQSLHSTGHLQKTVIEEKKPEKPVPEWVRSPPLRKTERASQLFSTRSLSSPKS